MDETRGDGFRWRTYARRIRLWSPVLAAILTYCVCGVADALSRLMPALDWAPIAALALNPLLAAAGSTVGSLLSASPVPRERWKAAAVGAAWGVLGYWFALVGLALLMVPFFVILLTS